MLAAVCAECGAELKDKAKFCSECGTAAGQPQAESSSPARTAAEYTPKHLAEKILQSRSALEGERKQVTVLFADVKGSMGLAGQLDPEDWHHILDRFFAILNEGVHRFEGTVNQYTGDGIMALFGAPIAHEDHAQRACYAALQMRDDLRRFSEELRVERGLDFGVRIGINSGDVVVGKIGDDLRMDYTAQGHTVGLAQRLEQLAESGHVYLSEHTQRLVEGYFELRDLGRSKVAGTDSPVGIFELERVGVSRTRLDVSRMRGLTRFVGRVDEMKTLEAALARAKEGYGQVVGVVGEPGLGKSRLCFEFVQQCRAEGVPVFEAHCLAHGKNIPFIPILELFRNYFDITDQDTPAQARRKIAGHLVLLDPSLQDTLPMLFDFLGVGDPDRPAPRIDADARQHQLVEMMRQTYRAQSEQGIATVAFFDDLHWVDPGSDAFIEQIVAATENSRNLLLVNFRPEYQAAWTSKAHYQQLPLVPLGTQAIQELVESLLGRDGSLSDLAGRIVRWTSGNPFYTEEIIQELIENGHLEGSHGAYRLVTAVDSLEVPINVHSVLAARIDRLPDTAKQLLQTASVIGKMFSGRLLDMVADLTQTDLNVAIERLNEGGFIYEQSLYPVIEYAFKHPLTQEVAYNSQLQSHRISVHGSLARALERQDSDNLDERAALLAYHWDEAEDPAQAIEWHQRAAVWSTLPDGPAALRHWQRVRDLAAELPPDRDTLILGARACARIIHLGWRLGAAEDQVKRDFEDGKELAERAGDMTVLSEFYGAYAAFRGISLGYGNDYANYAGEATRLAEMTDNAELLASMRMYQTWGYLISGRNADCCELAEYTLGEIPHDDRFGVSYAGTSVRLAIILAYGIALSNRGLLTKAKTTIIDGATNLRSVADFQEVAMYAAYFTVNSYLLDHDIKSAFSVAQNAFGDLHLVQSATAHAVANAAMGRVYLAQGERTKAMEFLQTLLAIADESHTVGMFRGAALGYLSEACIAEENIGEACRYAEEAVEFCRPRELKWDLQPWLAMARAQTAASNRSAAESAIEEAQSIIDETGAVVFLPFLHEIRAEFADTFTCDWKPADQLAQARKLFAELGMTEHAERVAKSIK